MPLAFACSRSLSLPSGSGGHSTASSSSCLGALPTGHAVGRRLRPFSRSSYLRVRSLGSPAPNRCRGLPPGSRHRRAEAVYRTTRIRWHTVAVRTCVVGAGAIGGMMAARLAVAGHDVSVIARGEHLYAIRRDGLRLVELDGTETVASDLDASDDFGALGTHDAVILALKAHQIAAVAHELARLCDDGTMIVPVQNGIGWWYFQRHGGPH
ncbi:MAG: hypothetical protein F4232_06475, partial [Acidimicrobiaceae bacterium]|nr:hypothetical protein [Acidimicrobiaceae bacterium]